MTKPNTHAGHTSHKDKTSYKHSTNIQPEHVTLLNQVCKKMKKKGNTTCLISIRDK